MLLVISADAADNNYRDSTSIDCNQFLEQLAFPGAVVSDQLTTAFVMSDAAVIKAQYIKLLQTYSKHNARNSKA